ncbi:hypothetical protein [Paenibacillus sp. MMO-177]|uniref:hypothetical protein n=1 Tax=Paenibacillus sp. MMO-177 TaxID=3081289 RepID=UPI0030193B30
MQELFIKKVQSIVVKVLEKYGLLVHEWHLGKVSALREDGSLDVFIDGNPVATPSVPANPEIIFTVGDYVWVHYVNRNPNNLFIPYKRYVR